MQPTPHAWQLCAVIRTGRERYETCGACLSLRMETEALRLAAKVTQRTRRMRLNMTGLIQLVGSIVRREEGGRLYALPV